MQNKFVTQQQKTILKEFYKVAFCKKIYNNLDELQIDLDKWVVHYNNERTHQGKMCYGTQGILLRFCTESARTSTTEKITRNVMKEDAEEVSALLSKLHSIMLNDLLEVGEALLQIPSTRVQWFVTNNAKDCFLEITNDGERQHLLEFAGSKTDQEIFLNLPAVFILTKQTPHDYVVMRRPHEFDLDDLCELVFKSDQEQEQIKKIILQLSEYAFSEKDTYTSWALLNTIIFLTQVQRELTRTFKVCHSVLSARHLDHLPALINSPYQFLFNQYENQYVDIMREMLTVDIIANVIKNISIIINANPKRDSNDRGLIADVCENLMQTMQTIKDVFTHLLDYLTLYYGDQCETRRKSI